MLTLMVAFITRIGWGSYARKLKLAFCSVMKFVVKENFEQDSQ